MPPPWHLLLRSGNNALIHFPAISLGYSRVARLVLAPHLLLLFQRLHSPVPAEVFSDSSAGSGAHSHTPLLPSFRSPPNLQVEFHPQETPPQLVRP